MCGVGASQFDTYKLTRIILAGRAAGKRLSGLGLDGRSEAGEVILI